MWHAGRHHIQPPKPPSLPYTWQGIIRWGHKSGIPWVRESSPEAGWTGEGRPEGRGASLADRMCTGIHHIFLWYGLRRLGAGSRGLGIIILAIRGAAGTWRLWVGLCPHPTPTPQPIP